MKRRTQIMMGVVLLKGLLFGEMNLPLNEVVQETSQPNEWKYFKVEGGASSVTLFDMSEDFDLYVKEGEKPTENNWDCSPLKGISENETCEVDKNKTIYIGVKSTEGGEFSIIAKGDDENRSMIQKSKVYKDSARYRESGTIYQGRWRYIRLNGGATFVRLTPTNGDLDLYVKYGRKPTLDNWDCRSAKWGTSVEGCRVDSDKIVYIGIYGYETSGYSLYVQGRSGGGDGDSSTANSIVSQAYRNAANNYHKTAGYVTWNGVRRYGVWADSQYTYCARFVRMCFGEPAKYSTAISMYYHFANLNLIRYGYPPKGAVVFYAKDRSNGYYGHVGISRGDGYIYSVTSRWRGVTLMGYRSFRAAYLGYVTAENFKRYH